MARTATETATILSALYDETFGRETYEPFRITWPQLRYLAEVPHLNDKFLKELSDALSDTEDYLIPCNNFLLFAAETDLAHYRMVPDRLLEKQLLELEDIEVGENTETDDDI